MAKTKSSEYELAVEAMRELVGRKKAPLAPPVKKIRKVEKTAVFSDIHAPFHDIQKITSAVADALARGCTRAIIAGDLLDSFSFSHWIKTEHVTIEKDLTEGSKILQLISESFEEVQIIAGNHDMRAKKYFANRLPPEYLFLVNYDLLGLVAADFKNVSFPKMVLDGHTIDWMVQVGDAIIGHPETSSKVSAKPISNYLEWIDNWSHKLKLKPYRLIAMGHTHSAGGPWMKSDRVVMFETGCLCKIQGYALDANIKYRPPTNAYLYLEQHNGATDLNKTQIVFL